jgi:hypothetical protein
VSRRRAWPAEVAHRPVCPKRDLPIPFINEIDPDTGAGEFGILDDRQARKCVEGRLCATCGLPMGEFVALLGDVVSLKPGGFYIEPPVHERCGEIAAVDGPHGRGLCPFMAGERVPRRLYDGPDVAIVGTTAGELATIGRTVPKRDWIMAITRDYAPAMTMSQAGSLVMIYQAGRIERVRRFTYGPDGWLTEVRADSRRPAAPAARFARTQPRRTTRAGRRR